MAEGREAVDFHQSNCKKTKSLGSRHFTLRPKSKDRRDLECLLLDEGDGLSKKVWVRHEHKPNYGRKAIVFFY
jgi:hypothetical protein